MTDSQTDSPELIDTMTDSWTKDLKKLSITYKRNGGSREEDKVTGFFIFSHIRMRGYLRVRN